ncbi:MAG: STT3 domain-containing protein [Candidatus Pacearchaeota archaeon]
MKDEFIKTNETNVNNMENTDSAEIELNLKNILDFLNKRLNWIVGFLLAFFVWLSMYIRTRNIDKLKDITTGTWTLGPDLDPFLFLRWAKYIAEHGKLFALDSMRNVPLAEICSGVMCDPINTAKEMKLLSYMIAWFYNLLSYIPSSLYKHLPGSPPEITVTYAAVLFPVVMFGLTVIAFFFFARVVFLEHFENKNYANVLALISSLFLSVIPTILPRTIAGIPEKESVGFLFISLSLYFIITAFKSKNKKPIIINSIFAGISTTLLGLTWGGVVFVFTTIGLGVFVLLMIGQINKDRFLAYTIWILTFTPLLIFFSARYNLMVFLSSTSTLPMFMTWFIAGFNIFLLPKIKNLKSIKVIENKVPEEFISLIIVGLIGSISVFLILGKEFFTSQLREVYNNFVRPLTTNRFLLTVAENKQPFFDEWSGNFGPIIGNSFPLLFWIFMLGSITLFYHIIKKISKKERVIFTIIYSIMLFGIIFSRYSASSLMDGSSIHSKIFYFGGILLFIFYTIFILYKCNLDKKRDSLPDEVGPIILFTLFFISLIAARGAIRLIMVLVPSASIIASYLVVIGFHKYFLRKKEGSKILFLLIAVILSLAAIYSATIFYNSSFVQAEGYAPYSYTYQWQKAMSWVRENTPKEAVFAHWWDYGYWIQSLGERATILDGGNAIGYWNHLLGRHVLTTPNDSSALEFLYTHNATHLLIDSTDIGKYPAFSSIGGDLNNDRFSYIPTLFLNNQGIQERKNSTLYIYTGSFSLDEDIVYVVNGTKNIIPVENSGIVAVILEVSKSDGSFSQPLAVFVQRGLQLPLPLRYLYVNGNLTDFGSGVEAGVFVVETLRPVGNTLEKNELGSVMYLSSRTINSLLVRKYFFEEEGNFKLVHSEPNILTQNLRDQGFKVNDFSYFQGSFLGPIKIWEIEYPKDVNYNKDYLVIYYPDEKLA